MLCSALLAEAGIVIDAYSQDAPFERKQLVSCRMVRRQLDAGTGGQNAAMFPLGASQASASALGYQQSWTVSGGGVGELYLSKLERSCWAWAASWAPTARWRTYAEGYRHHPVRKDQDRRGRFHAPVYEGDPP